MKTKSLAISLAVIAVLAVAAALAMNAQKGVKAGEPGQYEDFAKCLTEKGVKMYGAYWCPHCQNQEKMFGGSWKYVDYIECSLPNRGGQNAACNNAGINGYPTWEFANGERVEGEVPLQQLSEKSGCSLGG